MTVPPAATTPFDFHLRTRIVFGPDELDLLGGLAGELGASRALVVSDTGVIQSGHAQRGIDSLRRAGIATDLFQDVHENPTTDDVEAGTEVARSFQPQLIVGLGGGSSMDCAKGINFLYTNGGRMQDYWGVGKAECPMLPMIAVPTTAGTGSETQSYALISDARTHAKMACGDPKASFHIALLDPKLTVTQPRRVTALTGVDAIAHAVETYVTKTKNPLSMAFSREAWRLLACNFPRVLQAPDDLAARGGMQLGACYSGIAIEHSMLGATHALANPLTAEYRMIHGEAIGLMLPHVVRYNSVEMGTAYRELLEIAPSGDDTRGRGSGPQDLADLLSEFVAKAEMPVRLSDCGVQRDKLPQLAEAAAQQWTGRFNPREVDHVELLNIYEKAL